MVEKNDNVYVMEDIKITCANFENSVYEKFLDNKFIINECSFIEEFEENDIFEEQYKIVDDKLYKERKLFGIFLYQTEVSCDNPDSDEP